MNRQAAVRKWIEDLEAADHFIEPETAVTVAVWWDERQGPLILEGPPGGGKTSLAGRIAKVKGSPLYRLQCYKSLGAEQALYNWNGDLQRIGVELASNEGTIPEDVSGIIYSDKMLVKGALAQALSDPHEDVMLLIDELDKIPPEEAFEGLLLEYLEEHAITVAESGKRIKAARPPHTVITSNAGLHGMRESLSHPVLRRGKYIYLPEPTPARQFAILKRAAPDLSDDLLRDCVLFVKRAAVKVDFEKSIALSETIMWARSLQWLGIEELTEEAVKTTVPDLAKTVGDQERLRSAAKALIDYVKSHRSELHIN